MFGIQMVTVFGSFGTKSSRGGGGGGGGVKSTHVNILVMLTRLVTCKSRASPVFNSIKSVNWSFTSKISTKSNICIPRRFLCRYH